ncbi:MAG: hypothetical protein HRU17_10930 [Polyangiaceae bacterium]|nr:hypothetical protein [Polyangiaceae bacterium]
MRIWIPLITTLTWVAFTACSESEDIPSDLDPVVGAGDSGSTGGATADPGNPVDSGSGDSGPQSDTGSGTGGTGGGASTPDATVPLGPKCSTGGQCADNNSCTEDLCLMPIGFCTNEAFVGATDCDDGRACTVGDQCVSGQCVGTNNCNNSEACMATGLCGVCESNEECDTGNPCTQDSCESGKCLILPREGSCEDGIACTTGETCNNGDCIGGTPDSTRCDDGDDCTNDVCSATGCSYNVTAGPCSDGVSCHTGMCQDGICITESNCPDGGLCNPASDSCLYE